ncbi:MAG: DUF507 family protein [Terriglobia bacterium]
MKLSDEKILRLSHLMLQVIQELDEIEIFDEPNNVRLEIVTILKDLMREEEEVQKAVRLQITSQKRVIVEGSAEWDILYRKYYNDALRKLGVVFTSQARA